jgi:hypothetical protein
MDPNRLNELERLEREATPGPWNSITRDKCTCKRPHAHGRVESSSGVDLLSADGDSDNGGNDARFVAAIRSATPEFLAAARRLAEIRVEATRMGAALREMRNNNCVMLNVADTECDHVDLFRALLTAAERVIAIFPPTEKG